jgi:hypothetical protein
LDRHQIANIAPDEVWWGISIGSDETERRENQRSVSVVLEDNASGIQKKFVLDGAPPDCGRKKDDMISRRREVRDCMSEWRAFGTPGRSGQGK